MLSYLPLLKSPWATAIFTLETTLVSGKWEGHPDPRPGPPWSLLLSPALFSLPGVVGPVGDEGGQEPFDLEKGQKKGGKITSPLHSL